MLRGRISRAVLTLVVSTMLSLPLLQILSVPVEAAVLGPAGVAERTIGAKPGTGGSQGAAYLKTTLDQPVFPDLWAIRAVL